MYFKYIHTYKHYIPRMSKSNNITQANFQYVHNYIHYIRRMAKSNNHSTVEYCALVLSFFFKDLLLVTQNGSITVVLFPLQIKTLR